METKNQKPLIGRKTSRRITSLRFLLAVFVVFIHNNFTAKSIAEIFQDTSVQTAFCQNAFGKWTQLFISDGIAWCAVPLFFLFAAYLAARKDDSYPVMLRKKAKSLLLPFVLWTGLYVFFYGGIKLLVLRIAPQFILNPNETVLSWTAADWLHKILGYNAEKIDPGLQNIPSSLPELTVQFWFVRDLLILFALSPILKCLIRKFPASFLALVCVPFFADVPGVLFVRTDALLFFCLGTYWGIYDIPLFERIDRISWAEVAVLFALTFVFGNMFDGEKNVMRQFMVIFSCVLMLKCSALIERNERAFAAAEYLAPMSFWLFAVHNPLLNGFLVKLWLHFFPMTTPARCLAEYFCVNILTVVLGTASGLLLRKICPPLFSVLNGGRKDSNGASQM